MVERIITAEDMVDILRKEYGDHSFCCPLVGLYRCEKRRRGCSCHELHLINYHHAEAALRLRDAMWKIHQREWPAGDIRAGARHAAEMWDIADLAVQSALPMGKSNG